MKKAITILAIMTASICAMAQTNKTDTLVVKTSSICNMCKNSIEKQLNFEKGVKRSSLNVLTQEATIIYSTKKTNPTKLRESITKIGYDADTLKADPKAYENLSSCCKKGNEIH